MDKKRNAKGEGSFTKNPDGSVTHRKVVGYKDNGNRKVLTVTAPSKAACIREMKAKESRWAQEREKTVVSMISTVVDLCEKHLQSQMAGKELKGKSIDRRECTIKRHIGDYELGNLQVQAVTPQAVENHINCLITEGRLSVSSIEKVIDVLNAAWDWGIRRGMMKENPVWAVKPEMEKKIQKLRKKNVNSADVIVMSAEEERRFVAEAIECRADGSRKYSAGLFLVLLLYTGMRCGEMIALRWKDIDFQNRTVTIEKSRSVVKNRTGKGDNNYISQEDSTKNEKARIIKLSENALKVLERIREETAYDKADDFIAPTKSGRCNTATNLEHRAAVIYRKIGLAELGGSLHVLRRTFATNMYENGARVKEIAAYIGDLESTTERYYIAVRKKTVTAEQVQYVVGFPGEKGCDSA